MNLKQNVIVMGSAAILGLGSVGCATKAHVQSKIDEVNQDVHALSQSVDQTREEVRRNGARINEVDRTATMAQRLATEANGLASEATAAANAARDGVDRLDRSSRRLIYELVLTESQGNFKFNDTRLPDAAKGVLDQLVDRLKAEPANVYIEIEGHTDSLGSNELNRRIGRERAESVRTYLYQQHRVPMHKMSVISYGEDEPVAPNTTREGRAQNRRVVIKIVS